jgi:uncharacterized protein with von Willebrand factor type A (vWA) domain
MTEGRAEEVAVGFVTTLRRSGLDVSLTSSLLFADALATVGFDDPDQIYWAGRATLVHRPEDVSLYDQVFGAYWTGARVRDFYSATVDHLPVTIALDDPDAPAEEPGEGSRGETITVRYSSVETLSAKDFADYTDEELDEARRLMERIRLTGPTRSSRRVRPVDGHRGPFDVRRTVRSAMRAEGEAVRLHRRTRRKRPRRLVLLLDVSGSMESYARALIRFVHAAVAGRTRVEAFALGTRLTRLTRELSSRDPDRALRAASEAVVDWSGGTRLGDGLREFNDEWGCKGMARGAVVLIMSDGWDRGDPEVMDEQMQRLHRVAHRVIWVNPLKSSPGYAPLAQGMAAALPHVDAFLEGHSLESLEALAAVVLEEEMSR